MKKLSCGSQKYAWGKKAGDSMVAKLQAGSGVATDAAVDAETRLAELWIGVHTSLPSSVIAPEASSSSSSPSAADTTTTTRVLLKDFLDARANTYLGDAHQRFYAASASPTAVPFLLKVLSIDMALSIQAHPTRDLAKVLHAKDPKNYPDPNHKPELIVALTPFEALCCFRPLDQMLYFIEQSPQHFGAMVGAEAIAALKKAQIAAAAATDAAAPTSDEAKAAIRLALEHLYAADQQTLETAIRGQIDAIKAGTLAPLAAPPSIEKIASSASAVVGTCPLTGGPVRDNVPPLDAVHKVFLRTYDTFGCDVGLWMMYFLNYLQLQPGDGLFLGASEPHAYLSGDGVEIMANSDNVVRAGLTPKFKDVATLLEMLTYDTNALKTSKYSLDASAGVAVQQYAPPAWCDDFSLFVVRLSRQKDTTTATLALPSVGLAVCVKGGARVQSHLDAAAAPVGFGSNFVLPIGKATFTLEEGEDECTIFIGTTNVHGATAGSKL